jgi:RNA polymerase sigma factor (TIGR02999 family)
MSDDKVDMESESRRVVSELIEESGEGVREALDRAVPLVYDELRRLARRRLQREARGHTLSTTALVHEAYLRLAKDSSGQWRDHGHFLAIASSAMRRILVEHARQRHTAKRGDAPHRLPLDDIDNVPADGRDELLVALDDALERLAALDFRQARVVECRFFAGLTEEETAKALGIGLRTAKRDWAKARSWLYQAIYPNDVMPNDVAPDR